MEINMHELERENLGFFTTKLGSWLLAHHEGHIIKRKGSHILEHDT